MPTDQLSDKSISGSAGQNARTTTKRVSFNGGVARVWVRRAFTQGEACVSAEPERERGHGVADSVPDGPIPSPGPRLGISRRGNQSQPATHSGKGEADGKGARHIFLLKNKPGSFDYLKL